MRLHPIVKHEAIHGAGHADVGDHHIHVFGAEDIQGALAGGDDDSLEPLTAQKGIEQTALGRVVIHDEDARLGLDL